MSSRPSGFARTVVWGLPLAPGLTAQLIAPWPMAIGIGMLLLAVVLTFTAAQLVFASACP